MNIECTCNIDESKCDSNFHKNNKNVIMNCVCNCGEECKNNIHYCICDSNPKECKSEEWDHDCICENDKININCKSEH